jgi:hypothetical protein
LLTCPKEHIERDRLEPRSKRAHRTAEQLNLLVPKSVVDLDASHPPSRRTLELLASGPLVEQHERQRRRRHRLPSSLAAISAWRTWPFFTVR